MNMNTYGHGVNQMYGRRQFAEYTFQLGRLPNADCDGHNRYITDSNIACLTHLVIVLFTAW